MSRHNPNFSKKKWIEPAQLEFLKNSQIKFCYVFLKSNCRGEWDLGGHFRQLQRECGCLGAVLTSGWKMCLAAKFVGNRHSTAAFSLQVQEKGTDLKFSVLYILILRTSRSICTENLNASAHCFLPTAMPVLELWPHVCHVKITVESLPTNWLIFTITHSIK